MGLFNNFPYMDLSNLNLDFILKKLKDLTNYTDSAEANANRAENAKNIAVTAQNAAESAAGSAESSSRDAQAAETSAENYAAHIADPVSGLVTGWLDDNIGPTTPPVDASLTIQGAAADAKATGDALDALRIQIAQSGIKESIKQALLMLADAVGYEGTDGDTVRNALYHALYESEVVSISAAFTQGGALVLSTDSLDSLRQYLTVTATYDDTTTAAVTTYTLSGTLTAGTSTVTVTYMDKTTTFTVDVTGAEEIPVDLSTFVPGRADKTNVIYNSGDNSLTVSSKVAWQYVQAKSAAAIPLAQGYTYRLTFHMDYVSGACRGGFEDTGGSVKISTGAQTTSGEYSVITSLGSQTYTNDEALIMFGVTWSTTENGNATFSNVQLVRYLTPAG